MYKHIKYRAELIPPECSMVKITILEQTHRTFLFGNVGSTFTYRGYSLISSYCPSSGFADSCYLRGSSAHNDGATIIFPAKEYAKFKKAVLAYNEHFKE